MFARVMFRWNENPTGTEESARRLWVETKTGDRWLATFAELDALVGRDERRLLVRAAIRQFSDRWNRAEWRSWAEQQSPALEAAA